MSPITSAFAPVFERPGVTLTGLTSPQRGARENSVWRFRVQPGAPGHPHRVTREETFVALKGSALVAVDGETHMLAAGDAIAIPAGARLQMSNPGTVPFEGIAVLPVGGEVLVDGQAPFVPPWAA